MKRISMLMFLGLLTLGVVSLTAAPSVLNVGDAHELDTDYPSPFNVNFAEWFATHKLPPGEKGPRMDLIYKTPRVMVLGMTIRGNFPLHYHLSSDEILVPIKGECQEFVNGKWSMVKPGDIHYNPRGAIHGLQCAPGMEFQSFDIFTPALAPGGDRVMLDSKESKAKPGDVVGDWPLIDTQFKSGVNINLDEWYASHPIPAGQTMKIDLPIGTPRNQLVIAQMPALRPTTMVLRMK